MEEGGGDEGQLRPLLLLLLQPYLLVPAAWLFELVCVESLKADRAIMACPAVSSCHTGKKLWGSQK